MIENRKLADFVRTTRRDYGRCPGWKSELFPEVSSQEWLDTAVLAGESVHDLIDAIHAGRLNDTHIDSQVLRAFRLQYPNVQEPFVGFVRAHSDPDELRGIFSGVRGKYFELLHLDLLQHTLPEGYAAHLAESPTQPGYDIRIDGPDHKFDYIQDKFTQNMGLLREAAHRWPEFDIAVPHETLAHVRDPELLGHLFDSGIESEMVNAKVEHAFEVASQHFGFHLPKLAIAWILFTETKELIRGSVTARIFLRRTTQRLKKSVISSLIGQGAIWSTGEPVTGLCSVLFRLLWSRYDVQTFLSRSIEGRLNRIKGIHQLFCGDSTERAQAYSEARWALLSTASAASGGAAR
jgi:hypothetical protein